RDPNERYYYAPYAAIFAQSNRTKQFALHSFQFMALDCITSPRGQTLLLRLVLLVMDNKTILILYYQ
ncbi:hypothetical protein PQE43_004455, partial [Klebsiella pneumoniae]